MTKIEVVSTKGKIDRALKNVLHGWIWDANRPTEALVAQISIDGALIGSVKADRSRKDLVRSGIGGGAHAFELPLPPQLCDGQKHKVTLEAVTADGRTIIVDARTVLFEAHRPSQTIRGRLEGLRDGTIIGWVWDEQHPTLRLPIELHADGRVVAKVVADRKRSDLAKAGIGDGQHAFKIPLSSLPVDLSKPIEVRVTIAGAEGSILLGAISLPDGVVSPGTVLSSRAATGKTTTSVGSERSDQAHADGIQTSTPPKSPVIIEQDPSPVALTDTPGDVGRSDAPTVAAASSPPTQTDELLGALNYERGILRGWVCNPQTMEPHWVSVAVDGEVAWAGSARRLEKVTLAGADEYHALGFRVQLPQPKDWTSERTIEVRTASGQHVPGSPVRVPFGADFLGQVEKIERTDTGLHITGWCIDASQPSSRVPLTVVHKGDTLLTGETDQRRPELSSTGFDAPFGGFALHIDDPDSCLDPHELAIRPGFSLQPLPRAMGATEIQTHDSGAAAKTAQRPVTAQDDEVEGTIDEVNERFTRGWARNKNNPDALVVLDCFIDGVLYATTSARRFRGDLKKHFNDHGFHEYLVELTPACAFQRPGKIEIVPRVGRNLIKQKIPLLSHPLPKSRVIPTSQVNYLKSYRLPKRPVSAAPASVALIVINKDGATLLESFFNSFQETISYDSYEIIVIDHASVDDSERVFTKWRERLKVRWFQRGGNFSFSNSNNFGVAQTDADLVLFVNNDVTFTHDILGWVVHYMANPQVGCLGIRLMDDSPVPRPDMQSAIQHLGVHFQSPHRKLAVEPFESRYSDVWRKVANEPLEVPVVTGAFLTCRRKEFLEIGGFNELYFYGHEDVDLCLKYQQRGQKVVSANDLSALHLRGFSRDRMDHRFNQARVRNRSVIDERFGFWLRRKLAEDRFAKPGFWTSTVPRIAFAVTEATSTTLAGDYFTALELASQLAALFPCECAFVEQVDDTQYDLANFDVVIAMRDDYDPRKIRKAPPHILKVAWVRNWFERFAEREGSPYFDSIWASSPKACAYLERAFGREVALLPIATNWYKFRAGKQDAALQSDYCFTGSYWGLNREIVQMLDPSGLPFKFAIFGTGWEQVPHLAPYSRGPLPYKEMPNVYANTRLVIDDANHVTKAWGAVNSRVYDALAAGALIVTNGRSGSDDVFDGKLPTYNSPQELENLLWTYLGDEAARKAKVAELQELVQKRHTYQHRARTVWSLLNRVSGQQLRIAIKIGAPNWKVREEWGDYHYAMSMKHCFDRLGHSTRIDCLDTWEGPAAIGDDVVIVLRGLTPYRLQPHQINLMWNISHPDKVSQAEYQDYDHVFVASMKHAKVLEELLGERVSVLLQCTDPRFFHPNVPVVEPAPKVLFVGNSRNIYRRIVRDALNASLPLEVYGNRWEGFLPDGIVKGEYIPNSQLASYYKSAGVLLNDHWENMAAAGLLSNRLFDAAACGARILSDDVEGIADVFGDLVKVYQNENDLVTFAGELLSETKDGREARLTLAHEVLEKHTFEVRVQRILQVVSEIAETKSTRMRD